jgi:hypothetical protein
LELKASNNLGDATITAFDVDFFSNVEHAMELEYLQYAHITFKIADTIILSSKYKQSLERTTLTSEFLNTPYGRSAPLAL